MPDKSSINNWSRLGRRPFFKYMNNRYCRAMIENGSIRLGTLFDFRDMETHNAARGDKDEGIHNICIENQNTGRHEDNEPTVRHYLDQLQVRLDYCIGGSVSGGLLNPNEYVYSVSAVLDWNIAQEFDAECCVIIWDMQIFVRRLLNAAHEMFRFVDFGFVRYVTDRYDVRNIGIVAPCFIKNANFKHQAEWRLLMPPSGDCEIEPTIIEIGALEDICSVIYPNTFEDTT